MQRPRGAASTIRRLTQSSRMDPPTPFRGPHWPHGATNMNRNKRYPARGHKGRKSFANRAKKTHRLNMAMPFRGGIRL